MVHRGIPCINSAGNQPLLSGYQNTQGLPTAPPPPFTSSVTCTLNNVATVIHDTACTSDQIIIAIPHHTAHTTTPTPPHLNSDAWCPQMLLKSLMCRSTCCLATITKPTRNQKPKIYTCSWAGLSCSHSNRVATVNKFVTYIIRGAV